MNATATETPTEKKNVNPKIVNALLTLRNLSVPAVCAVTGISPAAMHGWLSGTVTDEDERLSTERQLEVLKVLGVVGKHPRSDVVHHWHIREPFAGDRQAAYEPLDLMLRCFGRAEVVHLTPERDGWASLTAKTYFGLTFEKFRAILEVQTTPFQALSFDPTKLANLWWAGTGAALVLEQSKFAQLTAPGESSPAAFDKERSQALEYLHWNKLTELAAERGLRAPELAVLLFENVPVPNAIGHTPRAKARGTRSSGNGSSGNGADGAGGGGDSGHGTGGRDPAAAASAAPAVAVAISREPTSAGVVSSSVAGTDGRAADRPRRRGKKAPSAGAATPVSRHTGAAHSTPTHSGPPAGM